MPGYTPSTDLDFHGAYTPPAGNAVDLAMPALDGPVGARGSVHLVYAKPRLAIAATVAKPPNRDAHVVLIKSAPTLHIAAHYDLLVTRPFGPEPRVRDQAAVCTRYETLGDYQVGTPAAAVAAAEWQSARRLPDGYAIEARQAVL